MKIRFLLNLLLALPGSIVFNFRYLPFKQAVKLPVFVYGIRWMKYLGCCGKYVISSKQTKTAMILLGFPRVSTYPNNGISIENKGVVEFKGRCVIGNNTYISLGADGKVVFGKNFSSTTSLKLVCYKSIEYADNVLIGWECLFTDTDLHTVVDEKTSEVYPKNKSIFIGENSWFAFGCTILKGTVIPSNTIVAAKSLLSKKYDVSEYSMLAGTPAKLVKENVKRID